MIPLSRPSIGEAEVEAVARVLRSGWLAHGPEVAAFEREFAALVGVRHAVALNSCASALQLALEAADVPRGRRGRAALLHLRRHRQRRAGRRLRPRVRRGRGGYRQPRPGRDRGLPHPADGGGDAGPLRRALLPNGRDRGLARRRGLLLVEDSAEAVGATRLGRQAGSFGVGCFSFFPTKNMTTGEGGMLTTDDGGLAARARALRGHGIAKDEAARGRWPAPWQRVASSRATTTA
jgi:perosamine synthetase